MSVSRVGPIVSSATRLKYVRGVLVVGLFRVYSVSSLVTHKNISKRFFIKLKNLRNVENVRIIALFVQKDLLVSQYVLLVN